MIACPYCSEAIPPERSPAEGNALYACRECKNSIVLSLQEAGIEARPVPRVRDVRTLAAEGSIGAALFAAMDSGMETLPVLPEVSLRILDLVNDPDSSMKSIVGLVEGEPVVAMRIMRMANSALYGGLQEITDLGTACSRLGLKLVANAVQTVTNGSLYATDVPVFRTYMEELWKHAVATAHAANELAMALSLPRPERLFLAGLIHDIGKVMIMGLVSKAKHGPLADVRNSPAICREVLSKFHVLVGLHVVQHWDLPPEFSVTTFCHHDPSLCPNPETLPLVHTVSLANAIARAEGYSTEEEEEEIFLTTLPSSQFLNMTDIRLAALRVDLADKVETILGES